MTSMRKKIARAIAAGFEKDFPARTQQTWDELSLPAKAAMLARADAVLDVLMEPTTAMEVDGALHLRGHPGDANGCFQAMIQAAKEGK